MIFSFGQTGNAIEGIPTDSENLHFVRPPKKKRIQAMLQKCRQLKKVSMSKSCFSRMPEKNKAMLKEKGIEIEIAVRQGRPISVPLKKMQHAMEMRKDYQTLREVERVTGIAKSTVHYLEKYAQRAKIKNGNKIIYLK